MSTEKKDSLSRLRSSDAEITRIMLAAQTAIEERQKAATELRTAHKVRFVKLAGAERAIVCVNASEVRAAKAAGTEIAKVYDLGDVRGRKVADADSED